MSTAGDAAALIALLLRLRPSGSGWVAALLAAELVPVVGLAPLAGRVVDRVESHRVLIMGLAGQALVAVPLAFVGPPWATVTLFAALYACSVFVRPATSALVPVITGEDDAARGYARLATGTSLGWIVGPVLGGLITGTLGSTAALLMDAASFAVLTGSAALVRTRRPPSPSTTPRAGRRGSGGGMGLIWQSRTLRLALLISAIAVGCAVVDNVAAPYRFIDQLGASSATYGAYLTLWGVGAFLGVQLLPRLPQAQVEAALAAGNLLIGAGIAGIGLAPTVPLAFLASVVGGVGNGLANVALNALIARHTPSTHRGRAFASAGAVVQAAVGVGTVAAAPLVTGLGANHAMTLAGGLAAAVAAVGVTVAVGRRRDGPPAGATAQAPSPSACSPEPPA